MEKKTSKAEAMFRELGYLKGTMGTYTEFFNRYPKTNEMASISFESKSKTIMASLYQDNNKLQKSRALAMTSKELEATYEYAMKATTVNESNLNQTLVVMVENTTTSFFSLQPDSSRW